jgi:hypothetical protein
VIGETGTELGACGLKAFEDFIEDVCCQRARLAVN